ncbi:MAG: cell division protein ZapB [Treponema sp.]|nr:cell division protein ZapB [Treponema sp.]
MISIDQVLLLEERVESAVKKIEQLNAENAALRSKCAELTNALAAKSEQFSSFESNQSKIEEGILKALSRLNAVENVVLSASSAQSPSKPESVNQVQAPLSNQLQSQPVERPLNQPTPQAVQPDSLSENQNSQPLQQVASSEVNAPSEPSLSSEESVTPEVDFEFGESDSALAASNQNTAVPLQSAPKAEPESSQPMFDIF